MIQKILKFLENLYRRFSRLLLNDNVKIQEGAMEPVAPPSVDKLPYQISDDENIARFIFTPINVNPKNNKLKPNCLKPPPLSDEVSVNRYDFTDASFLKELGLRMQNPKKEFYGLAMFSTLTIRSNNFDILYSPIEPPNQPENLFHADIKIGHIVEPEVELPAEISKQIRDILHETTLFVDRDTSTSVWVGDDINLNSN